MADASGNIWIVVPCYNEACRLPKDAFSSFAAKNPQVHFLWVDDGSTDGTKILISDLAVRTGGKTLVLKKNSGKAEAVRQGILSLRDEPCCTAIGFWDADLATPLEEILNFYDILQKNHLSAVMGSRWQHLGDNLIRRKWYRHAMGRIFAFCVACLLGAPVYDTQCGAKLITAQLARELFAKPFATKWFFDVEMLKRLKRITGDDGLASTAWEVPLQTWCDTEKSKVNMIRAAMDFAILLFTWRKRDL